MKKLLSAALVLAVVVVAMPSRADDSGVTLALRSGFNVPMGNISGDPGASLSDLTSGTVPIWIDAGYRFNKSILAGAYFQYGFSSLKNCTGSCSASNIRLGIEGIYNFMPDAVFAPWAGLGIGYEVMNVSVGSVDTSIKGFEFLNLQVGGDYRVSPMFSVGPFVALSLAKYSTISQGSISGDILNTSAHEWLQLGLKGTFNL